MTKIGRGMLTLALLLLVVGVALGSADGAALALALLLPIVACWLWLRRTPPLDARRDLSPLTVERGQPARGVLSVSNAGRIPTPARDATDLIDGRPVRFAVPRLSPGGRAAVEYALPTARRGVLIIGPIELIASDPFGFVRRTQRVDAIAELFVCPRVRPMTIPASGRTRTIDGAQARRSLDGSAMFHGLRDYTQGDDRRLVHWRSSARTGTLMVKQHVDLTTPEALIILDVDSSTGSDECFEEAVDVTASLAASVLAAGYPLRVVTGAGDSWRFRGSDSTDRLLTALSGVTRTPAAELVPVAPLVARDGGSVAAVITACDSDRAEFSRPLTARFGTVATVRIAGTAQGLAEVSRTSGGWLVVAGHGESAIAAWNAQVA